MVVNWVRKCFSLGQTIAPRQRWLCGSVLPSAVCVAALVAAHDVTAIKAAATTAAAAAAPAVVIADSATTGFILGPSGMLSC